ncbi:MULTISPECIES: hypothetical protein [unclassified Cryobacterium]|uniref:hypothetical protein n=1 Tax=unclassified Cryobacterium TaxID=2649013 RepID=UPI00141A7078|nr:MULTISPECIES: hypothetical protein [unclassified Cryobacterium]
MSRLQGAYIAPSDGLSLVCVLGADWLAAHKTAVKPTWGARAVGSIRHTTVQTWISKLA